MLAPLIQATIGILFLRFVFGTVEHVFRNKRGRHLPEKFGKLEIK